MEQVDDSEAPSEPLHTVPIYQLDASSSDSETDDPARIASTVGPMLQPAQLHRAPVIPPQRSYTAPLPRHERQPSELSMVESIQTKPSVDEDLFAEDSTSEEEETQTTRIDIPPGPALVASPTPTYETRSTRDVPEVTERMEGRGLSPSRLGEPRHELTRENVEKGIPRKSPEQLQVPKGYVPKEGVKTPEKQSFRDREREQRRSRDEPYHHHHRESSDLLPLTLVSDRGGGGLSFSTHYAFLSPPFGRVLTRTQIGVKSLPESVNKLINLQTLLIRGCPIKQLDLGTGLFTCSLCNLKRIELESTQVCKISISEDCCSGLEILSIRNNSHLTDIEVLPTTVKSINLENCKMLRNIRVIDSLVNIQKLKIFGCPKLDALPSVALFASLQEFELNGCDRFQEIQGLQHWTALEKSTAERLRRLQLIAIRRSVVEPYIQTMKKWPEEEIVVSVRALPGAASLVKSFPFRTLAVSIVASSDNQIIDDEHWCKLVQTRSPSGDDAIIVCFVINCVTPRMLLELFTLPYAYTISKAELEDGKWVWLAIFTQRSSWLRWNKYGIGRYDGYDLDEGGAGIGVVERAVVGLGEHS